MDRPAWVPAGRPALDGDREPSLLLDHPMAPFSPPTWSTGCRVPAPSGNLQTALAAAAGADHCLRLQLRRPCLACGAQSFAPQGHTYTQRRTWPWKRRSGWLASACTYVMAPPVVAARTRGIRHRRPLFRQRARGRGRGARRPASSCAARPPSYSDAACRWPAGGQRFWFCSPIEQSLAARGGIDQNGDRPEILSNGTEPRAPHVAARRPAAPVLSLARASERARRRV
jgi:hypothetical protein